MTIFLTVVITLAVAIAVFIGVAYWLSNSMIRERAEYEEFLRTWQVQQTEYESEQRLRAATRQAMNDMIAETRRATGGNGSDFYDPNTRG